MVPLRVRILTWTDHALAVLLGLILLGSGLAFGGAVWWWRPVAATLAVALGFFSLLRAALAGQLGLWKSPLPLLGFLLLLLALAQLTPWPARLGQRLSPQSRDLHARGVMPGRVEIDAPGATLPEALASRTPLTVDRSATLRWVFDGALVLVVFLVAGRFADRVNRLAFVWGSVVAVFGVNVALVFVQLVGDARGLLGFITPGRAGSLGPSRLEMLRAPGTTSLRPLFVGQFEASPWLLARADDAIHLGTMPGGGGAVLAMAALGLPLSLALALQLMSPRGSREGLWVRLAGSFRLGLAGLLVLTLVLGSLIAGAIGGPWLSLPFAIGLALTGLPAVRGTGLRWLAVALTSIALGALTLGIALNGRLLATGAEGPWQVEGDWARTRVLWRDSARLALDFPLMGTGMGTFATIYPSYKTLEAASTTARSSLLQFGVEAGLGGIALVAVASLWVFARARPAWSRVGTADRALAWGLIGTTLCLGSFLAIHWAIELPAVALAAAAWAGTLDRWLAGGTDLFVDVYA